MTISDQSWIGSALRDSIRAPDIASTDGGPIVFAGFVAANTDGTPNLASAHDGGHVIKLSPGDGLEVFCSGGNLENDTINYVISSLVPYVNPANNTVLGYMQIQRALGLITLGALTIGATVSGISSSLNTGDFWADTITETLSLAGVTVVSPAGDKCASIRVDGLGATHMLVEGDIVLADDFTLWSRRYMADAFAPNRS